MTKTKTKIFTEITLGFNVGQQIFGPGDFITALNNVTNVEDALFVHLIKGFEFDEQEQQLYVEYIVENINHQERDRYEEKERLVNPQYPLFVSVDVPLSDIIAGEIDANSFNGEIFENKGPEIPVVLETIVAKGPYRLEFLEKVIKDEKEETGLRIHIKAEPLVPVSEEIKTNIVKSIAKAKLNVVK